MRNSQTQRTTGDSATELAQGHSAFAEGAGLVHHGDKVLIGLSGKDVSGPIGLLAAILTNEIPGQEDLGVYGLLLDAKGHVQTDLRVLKRPGSIVAEVVREGEDAAREILGRYAPFSRVKVEDLSSGADEPWGTLGIYGPAAFERVATLTNLAGASPEFEELAEHQTREISTRESGRPLLIAGVGRPVAGYDLIGPASALAEARVILENAGSTEVSPEAYEAARIEAGVPLFGADLTPDNFPGEAGILDRAVSFAKGCYPGQETVARMHYRGHPNRSLYRLSVEGGAPGYGSRITQHGKEVGRLTSLSPLGDGAALGYLHRKADPDSALQCEDAAVRALYPV